METSMLSRLLRNLQRSALILLPAAVSAAPGEISKESIQSQGAEHTCFVFIPEAIAGHARAPLVMLLHGFGHDGRSLLDPWKKLASQEGLVLVAPNPLNPEYCATSRTVRRP
jgi:poly(3-hydroxybutyrate) depolymerase